MTNEKTRDDFVLINYDTKRVADIDAQHNLTDEDVAECPPLAGKYAMLVGTALKGDIHTFAQMLRYSGYREEAVWFDTWDSIDAAMTELRRRHPELELVDRIGTILDWPWSERSRDLTHLEVGGPLNIRHPEWRMVAVRRE